MSTTHPPAPQVTLPGQSHTAEEPEDHADQVGVLTLASPTWRSWERASEKNRRLADLVLLAAWTDLRWSEAYARSGRATSSSCRCRC